MHVATILRVQAVLLAIQLGAVKEEYATVSGQPVHLEPEPQCLSPGALATMFLSLSTLNDTDALGALKEYSRQSLDLSMLLAFMSQNWEGGLRAIRAILGLGRPCAGPFPDMWGES